MTERRPFPPSPRRLALARQAGLSSASPFVVGAAACVGALLATVYLARAMAGVVGEWIAAASRAADGSQFAAASSTADGSQFAAASSTADGSHLGAAASSHGVALGLERIAPRVLELAMPILAAAAIAAFVAHVAQTRALWLPRRRIPGAPVVEPARVQRGAFDIAAACVIGVVAFGWLWMTAPRLAALFAVGDALPAVGSAVASLVAALAIAWVAIGVLDALLRHVQLARALAMTVADKREDDRLAAADPRWRAHRAALARRDSTSSAVARSESTSSAVARGESTSSAVARGESTSSAVARAALVLLGDDIAVAIAWDPRFQPVPLRTITGRRAQATQLLGLARRHRIAVHRDAQLAAALVDAEGPVPDTHWARLAEIIAAAQRAHTGRDLSR